MGVAKSPKRVLRYGDEFKAHAVQLSRVPGVQVKDVAEALDVHPFMLSRWRKQYREGQIGRSAKIEPDPKLVIELKRLRRLEREHAMLKEEHALLKKAIRFCSEERARSSRSLSRTGGGTPGQSDVPSLRGYQSRLLRMAPAPPQCQGK